MKNKAPLSLMEQVVMLLVFALAAALCLQIFVLSGQMSKGLAEQDKAVIAVQNAAETVKICGGDAAEYSEKLGGAMDGDTVTVRYDADWQNSPQGEYRIVIERTVQGLLGSAEISAQDEAGKEIFAVTAAWQEAANG